MRKPYVRISDVLATPLAGEFSLSWAASGWVTYAPDRYGEAKSTEAP
jgi:hypothetical protein